MTNCDTVTPSKFHQYLREREDVEVLEIAEGYATYKITDEECYLKDIFVLPGYRMHGAATYIANQIADIARAQGCKVLTGSCCPEAKGSTESLKVLLAYGMRLHSCREGLIIMVKDL